MPTLFLVAFPVLGLINTIVAVATLLRSPAPPETRPTIGLSRVLASALAVTGTSFVAVVVLLFVGLKFFGIVRIAWIDVSVVMPLTGVAALLAGRRRVRLTPVARACAWLSLLALPIAAYAVYLEPTRLQLEQVDVPLAAERAGSEPLLVAVLADLQTDTIGPHEERAVEWLMAAGPDLVLIPGDLFQGTPDAFEEQLPRFRELLGRLSAPGGVWLVPGNVDWQPHVEQLIEGTAVTALDNESVTIQVKDREITLLGVDSESDVAAALGSLAARPGSDDVRLVLSHRPRVVNQLEPDSRVDLVVAGHTHGGQIVLPFLGPPLVLSPLPNRIAAGGLHDLDGRRLYISRGVGHERLQAPRIRFLCPPEVTLLTLTSDPVAPE